jgi:hypothetical protein
MKRSWPLALGFSLIAAPAFASTEFIVTGGGGITGEAAQVGCLEQGQGSCPANDHAGTILIGAGMARVSDIGVRGSLKLEGMFSFGDSKRRQGRILGAAGWQGDWLVVEGGIGSALLWTRGQSGAKLGGVLHAGVGLRVLRPLTVMARADSSISDDHRPYFFGVAIEYLPLLGIREGP